MDQRGDYAIHRWWCCPWGSSPAVSRAEHRRGTHFCMSATIGPQRMVKIHTHQRLARFFGKIHAFFCPFCVFVLFLRGKNPLLYRGIQYFGFPESDSVAPRDCFSFKSRGCIQMRELTKSMILSSNMTTVQDSTGIWAFKVKSPDHNFKIDPLLEFGCSYIHQSLNSGHALWQNQNVHWILHRNKSAGFENETILEVFTSKMTAWWLSYVGKG